MALLAILKPHAILAQEDLAQALHLSDAIYPVAKLDGFDGKAWQFKIDGTLTNNGQTSNDKPEKPSTISSAQVARWGSWRGVVGRQVVWLSDGSWLTGDIQFGANNRLFVENKWLELPAISLRSVRAIVYSPVASLAEWSELQQQLLSLSGENDIVWLRDRRQLSGVIDQASFAPDTSKISMVVAGQQVSISLEDVATIAFSPTLLSNVPLASFRIGLADGSLINWTTINSRGGKIEFATTSLTKVSSLDSGDQFVKGITLIDQLALLGVQRMDQLKPASYRQISDNSLEFELGVNQDVYGKPIRIGSGRSAGIAFRGLALHSSSQVAYRWDRKPARLLAEVRMADPKSKVGHVLCKVLLARDGKLEPASEFTLQCDSGETLSAVQWLEVDVTDAQLIVLVVEKGEAGQLGDHVVWLDARIVSRQ